MKTLFLYTQTEKESVEDYSRNLTSLWYTDEAFGASPGIHRGLVGGGLLSEPGCIADVNDITDIEQTEAETQTLDALQVPIAMEKLIASTVEKKELGKHVPPST